MCIRDRLNITLRLNFVPPYLDMEKLKGMILHRIEKLRDVRFSYVYEDVILQQEEIIRLFIPHMIEIINGKYAAITKTIQADKFTYNGQTLSIFALGRRSTEQLNEKVSRLFLSLIHIYRRNPVQRQPHCHSRVRYCRRRKCAESRIW